MNVLLARDIHPGKVRRHDVGGQPVEILGEVDLLGRCREGSTVAWKELYDAHIGFVCHTAQRLGTPDSELDDVCQETFLIAFRKLSRFHSGRFTTWLYRIAANVVSGRHRRRRFRRAFTELWGNEPDEPVSLRSPEDVLQGKQAAQTLAKVLERMAPKKREIFVLYELEELSGEEISERVGCKLETVRSRLHYARKEFESLLGKIEKQVGRR